VALRSTLVLVLAAIAAATAQGAPQADQLVRPGKGIGKISLGMTEAQVREALGKPRYVVVRRASFGTVRREWQYGEAAYTVTLTGRAGRLVVVSVAATLPRERTVEGFGVGTLERRLIARYGSRIRCEKIGMEAIGRSGEVLAKNSRECAVTAREGSRTVFLSGAAPPPYIGHLMPDDIARFRVIEVSVRSR